jgi:hypothetical protein
VFPRAVAMELRPAASRRARGRPPIDPPPVTPSIPLSTPGRILTHGETLISCGLRGWGGCVHEPSKMQSRIRAAPAHQGFERARLLQLAYVKHLGTASVLSRRSVVCRSVGASVTKTPNRARVGGSRQNP